MKNKETPNFVLKKIVNQRKKNDNRRKVPVKVK